MREFDYAAPHDVEEAIRLLAETEGAMALAGGTDIVVLLQHGKIVPSLVVDLKHLPGLQGIEEKADGVEVGALVSMTELSSSEIIKRHYPALAQAAGAMGCWQVRNLATVGGNICNASPSADAAPPLLLYNARVMVAGPSGRSEIDFAAFPTGPGKTALLRGELVVGLSLPQPPANLRAIYLRRQLRRSMDIPLVNVAVGVEEEAGLVTEARICLGAVAPVPFRAKEAEDALRAKARGPETIAAAAEAAAESSCPITDIRSSASYRTEMVRVLVRRALEAL